MFPEFGTHIMNADLVLDEDRSLTGVVLARAPMRATATVIRALTFGTTGIT